eukprot:scaffold61971_cov31-Tisochrysis_lutea.AAC.2
MEIEKRVAAQAKAGLREIPLDVMVQVGLRPWRVATVHEVVFHSVGPLFIWCRSTLQARRLSRDAHQRHAHNCASKCNKTARRFVWLA